MLTLYTFNSQHDRIKFTLEENDDGSVNFLDVTIGVKNNVIIFYLYRKPTDSGRYLNFYSNHPMIHKKGIVFSLLDRIIYLSHPSFHTKNITNMINILLENGYPLEFLFSTINCRLKSLIHNSEHKDNTNNRQKDNQKFVLLPYANNITEKLKDVYSKYNLTLTYKPTNTLSKFITTGKDKLNIMEKSHVVYRIDCCDCESSYVGQTKRKLGTRIKEHKADIKKSNGISVVSQHRIDCNHDMDWQNVKILDSEPFFYKRAILGTRIKEHKADIKKSNGISVVSQHRIDCNHDMDWQNIKILDSEPFFYKRAISEMIHIKKQEKGLNDQKDTDKLPMNYLSIITN
ncbi:hypothetical protein ALC57_02245 [Trachymyrmex cornetzi]|uniref:Helix-turn-helix domain-containing protein n=1 Tax=Trachymyrmex cornetzi TaxID=471704 RepID=A0A151JNS6_9HYME|nr:hypothetical protein ALC57_02245 [Trachymyrmex cornetzi]